LSQALPPGEYTLSNGAGTADIGPFSLKLSPPPPITWTNRSASLGREQHTYRWSGGDANGHVIIQDYLTNRASARFSSVCLQAASTGEFTLPSPEWLGGVVEGAPLGPLSISVGLSSVGPVTRFSAPGLDTGLALWKLTDQRDY
jgi:hypothetical protein